MRPFSYDLHVHSCLSPCGDDEATPNSIAGLASLIGLDIVALTDHNTSRNCPAFFRAAEAYGITPVAGMELTTAEDVHMVCLFPTLEQALAFNDLVDANRVRIRNRPEIFGRQLIRDEEDGIIGEEPDLLINATNLTLEEGAEKARGMGGAAFPAHIDRNSNGILAVLGMMPEKPFFPTVEFRDPEKREALMREHHLEDRRVLVSSDAHTITSLNEAEHFVHLDAEPGDHEAIRRELIALINRRPEGRTL